MERNYVIVTLSTTKESSNTGCVLITDVRVLVDYYAIILVRQMDRQHFYDS